MALHNITGRLGEDMAVKYLTSKGYLILHQNWRYSHWEIDIIASFQNKLHFIEVKTRRTTTFGFPEDDVSKKKMRYLMSSAEEFLYRNPVWKRIQFDILAITLHNSAPPDFFMLEDVSI